MDSSDAVQVPYGYVVREALAHATPVTRRALVGPRQRGFLAAVLEPACGL